MELSLAQCFDAMPCYLSVQDRNLRVLTANRQFREAFGNYESRYCYQVYKQRAEPCDVCPVERTFRDGQVHHSEERVLCLDGTAVSVIVYTQPIRDERGEISAVMEMSTDISHIARMQNLLREGRAYCRTLFEEVPCYISVQDQDLNIVDANRLHREAFGSFLGCKCYEIYKHRSEECDPCIVRQTFEDGLTREREEVVMSRQGRSMNVLVRTTPVAGPSGRVDAVMEMSADITQIRELQSQLESVGLLISSISHGLKGLLNGLNGGMYLVNKGLEADNPARVHQGWAIVQRNIERIRSMVLDILYYAKDREPGSTVLSAATVVDEVREQIVPRAQEAGIDVVTDVAPDAGQFEGDEKAVRAMLVNLGENALDACRLDRKKTAHQVALRAAASDGGVRFEIEDNGIGMERETRERAFTLFFSSKGSEGTGLGLFIANRIARAHGGGIRLESAVDRGTKFIVTLPRARTGSAAGDPS
jgi:PAS domain S-box-containing protein